jgi:glycosyltransferase involved in cell wall biosynthesis
MTKKILILCPPSDAPGGVAYYNRLVHQYFNSKKNNVEFFHTGKTYDPTVIQNRLLKTLLDGLTLIPMIPKFDLIVLNPSLDHKAIIRDGLFHILAKRVFNKKTLVFFHGWSADFEHLLDQYGKRFFKSLFNFDKACVLASPFKKKLISWGYAPNSIVLETTAYEEIADTANNNPLNLLFLSRFVKNKGCLESIQTVEILAHNFPDIKLYMVGDGELISQLKAYVTAHRLTPFIEFTGWLSGKAKNMILKQCGIMIYPTSYGEGLPISLLEGMGMGHAIITRPVAGIPDILQDRINGFLVSSQKPQDFADKIKYLLNNRSVWQIISQRNKRQAQEKFEIKSVVKRLDTLFEEITG